MDDQERRNSVETLHAQDNLVVWKTKDKDWTHELQKADFVQILSLDKDTKSSKWGHKIKGWWRRGDIKVTKCKKIVECWVKSHVNAPKTAKTAIKPSLLAPQQSYGKDSYTIDLTGPERTYWLRTESGLLGAFHFDGACTAGDGSCDVASLSMGAGFCNINSLQWLTGESLTHTSLQKQRIHEENGVHMGLDGRSRQGRHNRQPQAIGQMGHMEI